MPTGGKWNRMIKQTQNMVRTVCERARDRDRKRKGESRENMKQRQQQQHQQQRFNEQMTLAGSIGIATLRFVCDFAWEREHIISNASYAVSCCAGTFRMFRFLQTSHCFSSLLLCLSPFCLVGRTLCSLTKARLSFAGSFSLFFVSVNRSCVCVSVHASISVT